MDQPTGVHAKAAKKVVAYVISTQNHSYKIEPDGSAGLVIEAYCDSDFSGDSDTRRSVTGYAIFLCGVAVAWKSKGQRLVTLSSTEAEYVAITEVCQEVLFLRNLLISLKLDPIGPIPVFVDNIGAIFIATNYSAKDRTKHIDLRFHFVRQLVSEEVITDKFVRSADNVADIFTKNTSAATFCRHRGHFVDDYTTNVLTIREGAEKEIFGTAT